MAPKSKKAPSKKKMTKAERLRLMQEEEERRLKEEEEARLKFEKEEQERLEIQRIEREKWSLLEKKDLERRSQELEELALLEGCFPEAEKQKREIRALAQWKHYTECDGSPDPWVAQEMNTFISLWEEEKNQAFEQVMEKSKLVLSLIEKVKLILLETPTYELDHRTVLQHQGSILRLQELLSLKINVATELLLRQASNLADLDTGNMEKIIKDENVTLHRSVRFSETQIGFEIPRILATSNVALRLLHTRYDHITPLFPIAVTEQNQNPVGAEQVNVEESTEKAMTEEKLFTEEKAANEDEQPKAEQERELNLVQEENKYEAIENTVLQRTSDSEGEDSQTTQLELEMKLLSEAVLAAQLCLVENVVELPEASQAYKVDLCHFSTLGGVYHLDVLELPPQCKPVKGWVLVEILQEGLQRFIYPPDTTEEPDPDVTFPPIEVTLEIHKSVIFFERPRVVRWDNEGKFWRSDGISSVYYNREDRLLTFSMDTLGPVTLIQDAHVNMPYQSWEMSPCGMNKVLLIVKTVFMELQIYIKENLCMLASVKLRGKGLEFHLKGKWMAPIPFILALKEAGLNIFPAVYSHFYVVINNKVPQVELKAYRQMALLSSAFSFGWSKWNMVCNSTRVVIRVREQLSEETEHHTWSLLMFSGDRAQMLKMQEENDKFSEALREGTEFHSTLYHMMKDFASPVAMERVRHSNCQFIDSVCYMLLSIRVLSYS
ncbi:dynein axonemal intermediate chain 7 isoform X1 [Mus musculus]|uniref:dynein axonemal intermediate chain 7 isoform X1 n=1 Tax=Mus musculus TaxID=10090 RepID=UPI0005ABA8C6|nr:dynein axonemal intermediate chain 7 isoform X1 [Mus musculus]|eukprot:XP_011239890.1 PREDICTED: protein CASC1 isoform X1 [Mus musculus]